MNVQFKHSGDEGGLTKDLQEHIERKLTKMATLADSPEGSATAHFELERSVGSHQTGDVWRAALTIDSHGHRFYSSELEDTPEKAALRVIAEVDRELKKHRGKRFTLIKRGGGYIKSMQQRFTR